MPDRFVVVAFTPSHMDDRRGEYAGARFEINYFETDADVVKWLVSSQLSNDDIAYAHHRPVGFWVSLNGEPCVSDNQVCVWQRDFYDGLVDEDGEDEAEAARIHALSVRIHALWEAFEIEVSCRRTDRKRECEHVRRMALVKSVTEQKRKDQEQLRKLLDQYGVPEEFKGKAGESA